MPIDDERMGAPLPEASDALPRRPWTPPRIEDAAIAATAAGCSSAANAETFSLKNGS